MTHDDIIRMAREAGLVREWMELCKKDEDALARFANLVAAAEREACARVADAELGNTSALLSLPQKSSAAWNIAAAIRARKTNA